MVVRFVAFCLMTVLACITCAASPRQQSTDSTDATDQNPSPQPADVVVHKTPTQDEVKQAQGPVLNAPDASDAPAPDPEPRFSATAPHGDLFSISPHDQRVAQDLVEDQKDEVWKRTFGSDRPSLESVITDAIASGSEKVGDVTASEFLQKTVPGFVTSDLFHAAVGGASVFLDSEPTGGPAEDYPNSMKRAQSALWNVGTVGSGAPSPFADANLAQACDRLRSIFTQTQFDLNATQQAQVQSVLVWCAQQANKSVAQPVNSTPSASPRVAPGAAPKSATGAAGTSDCAPNAKVCH